MKQKSAGKGKKVHKKIKKAKKADKSVNSYLDMINETMSEIDN